MPRRSKRLDSQGYYDKEGLPIICYKEHLNRICMQRRVSLKEIKQRDNDQLRESSKHMQGRDSQDKQRNNAQLRSAESSKHIK